MTLHCMMPGTKLHCDTWLTMKVASNAIGEEKEHMGGVKGMRGKMGEVKGMRGKR